ncbi:MAG: DNRLRE domain-containing protein, partial [Clostridia bacterium]|nr:DNRLRE domain-containing protein [Clostridia bacterium]
MLSIFLAVVLLVLAVPMTLYAEAAEALTAEDETAGTVSSSGTSGLDAAYDEVFEDTSLREETVKHFRLSDGSYVAYQYSGAVHMLAEDGSWQDIDNRLSENGSEFSSSDARIKFVKKITGNESIFTLHEGNHKITMVLDGAIKKTPGEATNTETAFDESATLLQKLTTLDHLSSRVIYRDILDGVDLEYLVNGRNVKENLIVKKVPAESRWTFTLKLNQLTAALSDANDVLLCDGDTVLYRIPAPTVWDADGNFAPDGAAYYTLTALGENRYSLTITVDEAWMQADDRAYPVTVDPPIYGTNGNMSDTYVYEGAKTTSYGSNTYLQVGEDSSAYEYVSFFGMTTLPTLPAAATVIASSIGLYCYDFVTYSPTYVNIGVYGATSAFSESSTWTGLGVSESEPDSSLLVDYAKITSASEGTWVSWDLTELCKAWYAGSANYGVYFRDVQGTRVYARFYSSEATVRPTFSVQYRVINGVESYWTYRTQTAGLAGTGYVNMATGGLSFVFSGYSTDDGLMPYTPTLVYNSLQKAKYFNSSFGNTTMVANTGYGWKLDSQQSVVQRGYTNASGSLTYYYVWTDADGTEHAFLPYTSGSTTVYYDEDGLNLELKVLSSVTNGMKYQIVDTHGNTMGFSSSGYLVREIDSFGNARIYTRSGARLLTVSLQPVGGSAIEQVKFSYYTGSDATVLSEIEYVGTARRIRFYYSSTYGGTYTQSATGYLRKIDFCHYDSTTASYTSDAYVTYTYSSTGDLATPNDVFSSYMIRYTYTNNRVATANEYVGGSLGQRVGFTYEDGKSSYRTSGQDDVYGNTDDLVTTLLFDNHCRLVTTYLTDVNNPVLYGSSTVEYV